MGIGSELVNKLDKAAQKERDRRAAEDREEAQGGSGTHVVVTNIDISFGSMVWLLIKFSFATIPAAIVIGLVYLAGTVLLAGFLQKP